MRCTTVCAILFIAACSDPGNPATTNLSDPSTSLAIGADGAPPVVFNVELRAENEPFGASTSESKGEAQLKVLADGTIEFFFTINDKGDEIYNRAHIHKAPAGSNGGIHWDLLEAGDPVESVSGQPSQLRGVARARAAAVLADLLANPDQYYVNVHSDAFPGGSIRGQLR
jgi:hypothetical protein